MDKVNTRNLVQEQGAEQDGWVAEQGGKRLGEQNMMMQNLILSTAYTILVACLAESI